MECRTQEEIVARIRAVEDDDWGDWMGFRRQLLVSHLSFEYAKPYLNDGVTAEDWGQRPRDIEAEARSYLEFAIGKIRNHRGISASRSVDKLGEFAWLLGRDDVCRAMDEADYPNYGAPKVGAFARGMGWPWPDDPDLARMSAGLPCEPGCMSGCADD